MVPGTAVPGLVPPPNTVLHSFSPCGRYLIAFQPVTSEVVAFRFKGLHMASGGSESTLPAAQQLQASSQQAPHARQQAEPPAVTGQHQRQQPQEQHAGEQWERPVSFADIFEEHWRCCPCPGRQEQICTEFCASERGPGGSTPTRLPGGLGTATGSCLPPCLPRA